MQVKGQKIVFKTIRHCQHKRKKSKNRRPLSEVTNTIAAHSARRRDKKTDCETTLIVKLHKQPAPRGPRHLCEVNLTWKHNHSIKSAHALTFKPMSTATIAEFHIMFQQGHSPSSAKHLHDLNLITEHENGLPELERVRADRAVNPNLQDVYYLFRKWREQNNGKPNGKEMFDRLEEMVKKYNDDHYSDGGRAFLQRYMSKDQNDTTWESTCSVIDQPMILAVCTPLMARAHQMIRQSAELIYCDSTGSLDRYNSPTFVLSTSCSAGGVPLYRGDHYFWGK